MDSQRLVDTKTAAKMLGVSEQFLRVRRMNGPVDGRVPGPPYFKISGRAVRYAVTDLMAWLEQHRRGQ